jgi:hypothetical protein
MLIPYNYAYFWGSAYFIPIWIILFWRLPKDRKAMVIFGLTYMWIGLACEYFIWIKDWWHPITLTQTQIGIEDLIMCFTHVGIPIFIYKYCFGKEIDRSVKTDFKSSWIRFFVLIAVIFIPWLSMFFAFHIHSFVSTSTGMLLGGWYIILRRKDLIPAAIGTMLLMVVITIPVYLVGNFTSPGVIETIWDAKISGIFFLGIPIEDIIWYAILGFLWGGVYEYVAGKKMTGSKTNGLLKDISLVFNYLSNNYAKRREKIS